MKNYILFASIFVVLFSACSTKEVYEPLYIDQDWEKYENADATIIDKSLNIALLDNSKVLLKDGVVDVAVDKSHRVISHSDGWVVSSSIDGNTSLVSANDNTRVEQFQLKKSIAGATINGDNLAVLFADNEIAIYSISSKKAIFKEQGSKSLAVDARIVNPYFMNDLVLFSTLDGKVIIVNIKLKKKLRTVIVSSEDNFNNIIYLDVVDSKIIAATSYKILSLSAKEVREKYEIRSVVNDDKNMFITTKQGEVISLTPDLQVNAKIKFPFAHFLGMISHGDKLYILEKEGYMIVLDKDMYNYSVHEVDLEDGFVFVADKLFYVADEKISIE